MIRPERGTAVLEFVAVVVVLLIPLAVGIAAVTRLGVVRLAAAAVAGDTALAVAAGELTVPGAAAVAVRTWSHPGHPQTSVTCRPGCHVPGALVTATVTVRVPLAPLPGEATITQERTQPVDRYVPR